MPYFFVYPFAVSGDRASVPTTDPGSVPDPVSYQAGFTEDYQRVLGTDPLALAVPREQSNQIYYDITQNIQQYQTDGVPDWILASQNLGVAYPYDIYAVVRYDAGSGVQVYESQVNANTSTPGADLNWLVISGNAQGNPVGTYLDYSGFTAPPNYFLADGTTKSRTTYSALYNVITIPLTVTLTAPSPTFTVSSTNGLYVGCALESSGFASGTVITVISGTSITVSNPSLSTGSIAVRFFPYGRGDGSSTYNLPNTLHRTSVGSGGSPTIVDGTTILGTSPGQIGGADTDTITIGHMPNHAHPGSVYNYNYPNSTIGSGFPRPTFIAGTGNTGTVNVAPEGGGGAHNNVQPSYIVTKCIKYA